MEADTRVLHYTCLRTQPYKPYPDRYAYDEPHPCPEAVALFWEYLGMTEEEWRDRGKVSPKG